MEKGANAAAAAVLPGLQGWVGVSEDLVLLSRYLSTSATEKETPCLLYIQAPSCDL